jgi:hypothetical protein
MACTLSQAQAWYCYTFHRTWDLSHVKTLMMEKKLVSETLADLNNLTQMSAQDDLTAFCCRKKFKPYID